MENTKDTILVKDKEAQQLLGGVSRYTLLKIADQAKANVYIGRNRLFNVDRLRQYIATVAR